MTKAIRGPSPRGRGRLEIVALGVLIEGTIPAWAGETGQPDSWRCCQADHPRVGGGDWVVRFPDDPLEGPSPRGRGRPHQVADDLEAEGPSPRGRGRLYHGRRHHDLAGTIPAWAGETAALLFLSVALRVHPRVGGGDTLAGNLAALEAGPSPRGRGRHKGPIIDRDLDGTIPAWAGETRDVRSWWLMDGDHPRVGGGDSAKRSFLMANVGPSPRGRGRLAREAYLRNIDGTIPAWAGETSPIVLDRGLAGDHPRVGGGDIDGLSYMERVKGPSPRGRGRHDVRCSEGIEPGPSPRGRGRRHSAGVIDPGVRTIPAWAGRLSILTF